MKLLQWTRCEGNVYCTLLRVDISDQDGDGVYIIWNGTSGQAIYVGQGDIKERLVSHRGSDLVHTYGYEALLVTWAFVSDLEERLSIERYLHQVLTPVASTCGSGTELPVSLPGA